jgi:hypothetical protein
MNANAHTSTRSPTAGLATTATFLLCSAPDLRSQESYAWLFSSHRPPSLTPLSYGLDPPPRLSLFEPDSRESARDNRDVTKNIHFQVLKAGVISEPGLTKSLSSFLVASASSRTFGAVPSYFVNFGDMKAVASQSRESRPAALEVRSGNSLHPSGTALLGDRSY